MKRRIYKKWLKNPLNKRLIWKFCKPFHKVPPVAYVKPGSLAKAIEHIEMLQQKIYEESMIPADSFKFTKQKGVTTSGRVKERIECLELEIKGYCEV